ncbi:MAG TPA: SMC-Scp complex subunit ScpB [Candidatus Thermoplasmatota archaeon]|nr:SMC-Scp complex subunit ScpB [Candidatus Thermoplasmatota archaeon]
MQKHSTKDETDRDERMVRLTPAPASRDPVRVVEAALFSAGRPLLVDEIAENTGLHRPECRKALEALQKEYAARDAALEIARAGDKWAMQVGASWAPNVVRLAPMEIRVKLLKTLALIAYHQPLKQSDLIDMVGAKAYDHVAELKEAGLVTKRVAGNTFDLVTTAQFPEYFGIPATDRETIKRFLADKLGIPLPKDDGKGNKRLDADPDPETTG